MEDDNAANLELPAGRVFDDASGQQWRASFSIADGDGALEFTCLGDSRKHSRVMAVSRSFSFTGVSDESLRGWLASAPLVGRLTE